jgi:hypothetical protein
MTVTFAQVHVAVTQAGTWVSYGGTARIVLAGVLVAAAGGVAYAGTRLPLPVRPARPGEGARAFMLVTWGFGITVFCFACLSTCTRRAGSTCFTPRRRIPSRPLPLSAWL